MNYASQNVPRLDVGFQRATVDGLDWVVVHYTVQNLLDVPLLVFDRRWSDALSAFDRDQVDVEFNGDHAALRRCYVVPPAGVLTGDDLVPYGRLIAPGQTSETHFRLREPLREASAWLRLRRRPLSPDEATTQILRRVTLELGWSALFDREALSAEARVGVEDHGEILLPIPAELIAAGQQIVSSTPFYAELRGTRFSGGVLE